MTETEKLLDKWQTILSLQDWEIKVKHVHTYELDPNSNAQIKYSLEKKQAWVYIIFEDERGERDENWTTNTTESSILHELLHLHIEQAKISKICEEQTIEALVKTFLLLSRIESKMNKNLKGGQRMKKVKTKPSSGLTKKQKTSVVKRAVAGKDIGKKGKTFAKIAESAGGGEKGKRVAAGVMWKNMKRKKGK